MKQKNMTEVFLAFAKNNNNNNKKKEPQTFINAKFALVLTLYLAQHIEVGSETWVVILGM